ncbi:MAG: hypothetical protein ACI3X2_00085 [Butyricicoccus porcorum]
MPKVMRYEISDFLNVGTGSSEEYALMGVGFNTLDESPSAQTDGKVYISQKAKSNSVQNYEPAFPFDTDLMSDEKPVMALYNVGRNQLTGADAEMDYVRVEMFQEAAEDAYPARKFKVAVQVDSIEGEGGNNIKVTGSLLAVGDFVNGTFNTQTKKFTANT